MANSTSAANPELWSSLLEQALRKSTLFREIASFKEQAGLTYGDVIHRPYASDVSVDSYVAGTASTAQDITITDNSMTIDRFAIINVFIDDTQQLQSRYDLMAHYVEKMRKALQEDMDAHFLLEIRNAVSDVDNGDIAAGTAGDPFAVTSTNIVDVFTYADRYLLAQNAIEGNRFAVITPAVYQKLLTYLGGRQTQLGDQVTQYGYKSKGMFNDFKIYVSNNLPYSATWTPVDNPSNSATITIDSVVFTFVSSMGTTAGSILQTTSTAQTLLNLQALINAGGVGDDKNYYSLSAANKRKVRNWYATVDNATAPTKITVWLGGRTTSVTVATSEALDVWSNETIHQFFGIEKCTDMVVQKEVNVKSGDQTSNGKLGTTFLANCVYKAKTFYEGTYKMIDVKVTEATG